MPSSGNLFSDPTAPIKIALLGECMVELSGKPLTPLQQRFSGDTLNTAIYLSRLTSDLETKIEYATAIGTDAFSKAMLEQWTNEGLGSKYVTQLPDKNPGIYFIQVDDKGERSFSYWRNDSAARQYLEREGSTTILDAITTLDMLYISGISLAILPQNSRNKLLSAIQKMRTNGGKLVFDNNYRPLLWPDKEETKAVYRKFMSECDIALLTMDDECMLYGQIDEKTLFNDCKKLDIKEVVIKRGAQPCLIQYTDKNGKLNAYEVAATKVDKVIDTTAAGDSFSAAYLAARLHGKLPEQAAHWGHRLASRVIQHPGAIILKNHMPTISEISGEK